MKVVRLNDLKGTEREVDFNAGKSFRYLLEKDKMGYSLHRTVIPKGEAYNWHYKNHLESCYCIKGRGELINLENGDKHIVNVGDCYVLDKHDNHTFQALEDVVLISVFNPPCTGNEIHLKDNSYSYDKKEYLEFLTEGLLSELSASTNIYDSKEIVKKYLLTSKI